MFRDKGLPAQREQNNTCCIHTHTPVADTATLLLALNRGTDRGLKTNKIVTISVIGCAITFVTWLHWWTLSKLALIKICRVRPVWLFRTGTVCGWKHDFKIIRIVYRPNFEFSSRKLRKNRRRFTSLFGLKKHVYGFLILHTRIRELYRMMSGKYNRIAIRIIGLKIIQTTIWGEGGGWSLL